MPRKFISPRRFASDDSGNLAITFGLVSMISVAAVGGALDFGKAYNMRSKMQAALDASIVSGLSKYRETSDWSMAQAKAQTVFTAHFDNTLIWNSTNPKGALDQPILTITENNGKLTGHATATVNTPFMQLIIGQNYQILSVSSGEPIASKKLEVAVMVDLTGSMGYSAPTGGSGTTSTCSVVSNPSTKIDYLKCAGEDLINILLPTSGVNNANVRVGIAPFADYVNAGVYADDVTGLPATGGGTDNLTNLTSTKQRDTLSGTYSGWTAGSSGNGYGATGAVVPSGGTNSAGGRFKNSHCSTPTQSVINTHLVNIKKWNSKPTGQKIEIDGTNTVWPSEMRSAADAAYYPIDRVRNHGADYDYKSLNSTDRYIPMYVPASFAQMTIKTRTESGKTGNIGIKIDKDESATIPPELINASSTSGYWNIKKYKDNAFEYEWKTSGWYLPVYNTANVSAPTEGCETEVVASSSNKLITCVTERINTSGTTIATAGSTVTGLNYTDDAPAPGKYIGPYNHGATSKNNYSTDGKCWVAGRELPAVIPLTNNRSTLESFFSSATVGGATPGHLGTAWAGYLLSPDWSSIWPSSGTPASYSDTKTIKAAILMTDGEYNLQFSMAGSTSATSAKQALMLCKAMRDQGIQVYTIGFGFEANATPPSPNVQDMTDTERTTPAGLTAKARALDTLAKCASSNSSYYFPYDGESLRQTFKNISSSLIGAATGGDTRITN